MGYYATVDFQLKLKKECIKAFKRQVRALKRQVRALSKQWEAASQGETASVDATQEGMLEWVDSCLADLSVDQEGWLEYSEYYGKYGDTDGFALFLKDYVQEAELLYIGEDGERWGYYFDGDGKVYALEFSQSIGSEIRERLPDRRQSKDKELSKSGRKRERRRLPPALMSSLSGQAEKGQWLCVLEELGLEQCDTCRAIVQQTHIYDDGSEDGRTWCMQCQGRPRASAKQGGEGDER